MSQRWFTAGIVAVIVLAASAYVGVSLRRPEPPTFVPSPMVPQLAEGRLVGPRRYTVDARDADRWVFFSFAQGSVVSDPRPFEWDLAFRRFQAIVNGGDGLPGMGGVLALGEEVSFDTIARLPTSGYTGTRVMQGDSVAPALRDWYSYSFVSHLLSPTSQVYAVRTADGRYAKLRFDGYYCPGAQPGCVTFSYVYQGAGGPDFDVDVSPSQPVIDP